jgi:hypothetical protein
MQGALTKFHPSLNQRESRRQNRIQMSGKRRWSLNQPQWFRSSLVVAQQRPQDSNGRGSDDLQIRQRRKGTLRRRKDCGHLATVNLRNASLLELRDPLHKQIMRFLSFVRLV